MIDWWLQEMMTYFERKWSLLCYKARRNADRIISTIEMTLGFSTWFGGEIALQQLVEESSSS